MLPEQPGPHISLAALLAENGDREGAVRERRIAGDLSRTAISRQRANFSLDAGRSLMAQGKLEQALLQLEISASADPSYADVHLALAAALERSGRTADALAERQKAAQLAHGGPAPAPSHTTP